MLSKIISLDIERIEDNPTKQNIVELESPTKSTKTIEWDGVHGSLKDIPKGTAVSYKNQQYVVGQRGRPWLWVTEAMECASKKEKVVPLSENKDETCKKPTTQKHTKNKSPKKTEDFTGVIPDFIADGERSLAIAFKKGEIKNGHIIFNKPTGEWYRACKRALRPCWYKEAIGLFTVLYEANSKKMEIEVYSLPPWPLAKIAKRFKEYVDYNKGPTDDAEKRTNLPESISENLVLYHVKKLLRVWKVVTPGAKKRGDFYDCIHLCFTDSKACGTTNSPTSFSTKKPECKDLYYLNLLENGDYWIYPLPVDLLENFNTKKGSAFRITWENNKSILNTAGVRPRAIISEFIKLNNIQPIVFDNLFNPRIP